MCLLPHNLRCSVTRSGGSMKKLTIGELQLSSEVTHYVVPSKESAAYLQAKVLGASLPCTIDSTLQ